MNECDYCGERFSEQECLEAHLSSDHGDASSTRTQLKEPQQSDEEAKPPKRAILGATLGSVGVVIGLGILLMGGSGASSAVGMECTNQSYEGQLADIEAAPLMAHGNCTELDRVEVVESNGRGHASIDEISYDRFPPLSGTHAPESAAPGFYEEPIALPRLVHSLEHGQVVIYYDPAQITDETQSSLQAFARNHTRSGASIVVVPTPNAEPDAPVTLTAWRHQLTLEEYDARTVYSFLSEFLGRGPEHPVRND